VRFKPVEFDFEDRFYFIHQKNGFKELKLSVDNELLVLFDLFQNQVGLYKVCQNFALGLLF
jgi:hypothetical protein